MFCGSTLSSGIGTKLSITLTVSSFLTSCCTQEGTIHTHHTITHTTHCTLHSNTHSTSQKPSTTDHRPPTTDHTPDSTYYVRLSTCNSPHTICLFFSFVRYHVFSWTSSVNAWSTEATLSHCWASQDIMKMNRDEVTLPTTCMHQSLSEATLFSSSALLLYPATLTIIALFQSCNIPFDPRQCQLAYLYVIYTSELKEIESVKVYRAGTDDNTPGFRLLFSSGYRG